VRHVTFSYFARQTGFDGPEGDGSWFQVVRVGTSFGGIEASCTEVSCLRAVMISSFAVLKIFLGSTAGIGSRFHVLCARCRFRLYRGR
jgi:hypothetical protein